MKLEAFVFQFLEDLSKNNNRVWFKGHESDYKKVIESVRQFTTELIGKISAFDKSVEGQTYKTCIYRIYKDIRFSKDKTPYKNHIGVYIAPDGNHGQKAGYYLHIESGNVLFSGGLWCPPKELLKKIRTEIYYDPQSLLKILNNKQFQQTFGSLTDDDKLTRPPKGFDVDFEHIELLKYKSFCVLKHATNQQALADDFMDLCVAVFKTVQPLNAYMNEIIDF
ncbi:MAG: DUF2461 domain-containing protein [Bacteroidales bacterium]|jgi:uncharacterized protein (TIGR02453 family)|nr:DUF2461 domain-containing protein [Bacteroidales bacterium]